MKCYLHIGTEKTGTTSIQHFFHINREQLFAKNFFYPKTLGLPNNRLLSIAAFNPTRRDSYTKSLGLFTDNDLIEFQNRIIRNFKTELEELPSGFKVICSNEHIQSRLTTIDEIKRLKRILNDVGLDDIKIIVYLRNPSEIANSLFFTAIKSGSTVFNVPPPSNKYFDNICNHKSTIEKYSSVFGEENIILRLFRKDKLYNQSVIHDISKIIGIDSIIDILNIPKNQNESLSLLGLKILRNLNETIPLFKENEINNQRKNLVRFISKYFSEPKFVMNERLYIEYDSKYSESNQWIKETYFPEEPELFPYQRPKTSKTEISDDELKKITDFITEIWISRTNVLNSKWYYFGRQTKKQKFGILIKYVLKISKQCLTRNKKHRV